MDRLIEQLEAGRKAAGRLADAMRRRDQALLEAAQAAAELEELKFSSLEFGVGTIDWIRQECRVGWGVASDLLRVGQEMRELEASAIAAVSGEIGYAHLSLLVRTKRALRRGSLDEERLLAEARESSVGGFWRLCEQARHAADEDGFTAEQAGAAERRELVLRRREDGMVSLGGIFDPVGGAALRAALEPLARRAGKEDGRRRERRLADALVELAHHSLDQGSPRQRPHLNVTATMGTLYRVPDSPAAELDYCDPVSGETVRRVACDCLITRYVFEPDGILIDAGRGMRTISAAARRALERRDKTCRWPGCERPGSWCEAHHLVHWVEGGPTNAGNLVLLCNRHHWAVHEGRWQIFLYPGGRIRVVKPPLDFAALPRAG